MQARSIRTMIIWLLVILTLTAGSALAVPLTSNTVTQRQGSGSAFSDNVVPYGKSPTTGLDWEGEYKPVLVQISNVPAARPHWNLSEADIVYESILAGPSTTRLTALYSDNQPSFVGAVRSARLHHCSIRQEWDCPLAFWGGQRIKGTSIDDFFKEHGVTKEFQFDGTSKNQKDDPRYEGLGRSSGEFARPNPHDAYANIEWLVANMYPQNYTPRNHAFQFTDTPAQGFDSAIEISIPYGEGDYHPSYLYNDALRVYERSYNGDPEFDGFSNARLAASNVIVQRAKHTYFNNIASRPIIELTGEGQADIFIGGRHIRGKWIRKNYDDRTVFVDMTGVEVQFLPGKTYIQIVPNTLEYTYTRSDGSVIPSTVDESSLSAEETVTLEAIDEAELNKME